MAESAQAATALHGRPGAARMTLAALGIVYGDIGTSPLYALKQAAGASGTLTPDALLGIASLIFWSLIVVITLKYAVLILRADNRGEGGIMAMLALLNARDAPRRSGRVSLLMVGLVGAALLYGDGIITPAISVLSAIEGLKVEAPQLSYFIVPLTLIILIALFLVQRRGTGFVGSVFGPVMLGWFLVLALLGAIGIARMPSVMVALNPLYGLNYLSHAGFATASRCWAPSFWSSLEERRCTPTWAISGGCQSASAGSSSCCRAWRSIILDKRRCC